MKNWLPGASIFSCWVSADRRSLARSGKCLFEMKIHQICVYLMCKPIKIFFRLLHTYTYNLQCKAGCECQLRLKPRFHIHGMHMQHCGIHVFQTPLSTSYLFLFGKFAWTLELDGSRILWPSLNSGLFNHPFCHIPSRTYRITFICLHVFHFLLDSHSTYHVGNLGLKPRFHIYSMHNVNATLW